MANWAIYRVYNKVFTTLAVYPSKKEGVEAIKGLMQKDYPDYGRGNPFGCDYWYIDVIGRKRIVYYLAEYPHPKSGLFWSKWDIKVKPLAK